MSLVTNVFSFLLFFLIALWIYGIEEKNKFERAVSEAEYLILVHLVKGEFNTPVEESTRLQKDAIIKFQRAISEYTVNSSMQSMLFYSGKMVLKNNEVKKLLKKLLIKVNRLGTRR